MENLFPDIKIFDNVSTGFTIMDHLSSDWLINIGEEYGRRTMLNLNPSNTELREIIIAEEGIDIFLIKLSKDKNIIPAISPDALENMGIVNKYHEKFEEYADTWAKIIKLFIAQGVNVMARMVGNNDDHGGMAAGFDIDKFDLDDEGNLIKVREGNHKINGSSIISKLGTEGMIALHAMFHSLTPDEFHDWLVEGSTPELNKLEEAVIIFSKSVARFVQPKGGFNMTEYNNLLNPKNEKEIDKKTLDELTKGNFNLN